MPLAALRALVTSAITRLMSRDGAGQLASPDIPAVQSPLDVAVQNRVARAWEVRVADKVHPPLAGPGAARVRAAHAVISALARRAPPSPGIPAAVHMRRALVRDANGKSTPVPAPALIATAAQLRARPRAASELRPQLASLVYQAEEARRRREAIVTLLTKAESGTATLEEQVRLRHLVADTMRTIAPAAETVAPAGAPGAKKAGDGSRLKRQRAQRRKPK